MASQEYLINNIKLRGGIMRRSFPEIFKISNAKNIAENFKDCMFAFIVGFYNLSEENLKLQKLKICNQAEWFWIEYNGNEITRKMKFELSENWKFELIYKF